MTIKSKWARFCAVINGHRAELRQLSELDAMMTKNRSEDPEMHAVAVGLSWVTAMSYLEAYEHLRAKENDDKK